mgnify:CR=1 FL=1
MFEVEILAIPAPYNYWVAQWLDTQRNALLDTLAGHGLYPIGFDLPFPAVPGQLLFRFSVDKEGQQVSPTYQTTHLSPSDGQEWFWNFGTGIWILNPTRRPT